MYLPPLREVPEWTMDLRACELAGWRWLTKHPELVYRINKTLERMEFDHRIHLRKLMPVDALESTFIEATCHAEAGDNWGALSSAVDCARSEWENFNEDEKRKWLEAHPTFFRKIYEYWYGVVVYEEKAWEAYYAENPDVDTEESPPDSWLIKEGERMAWTVVGDWKKSAGRFYDDAVRLHISEDPDVRSALTSALAGKSLKELIESNVERMELRLHDPKNDIWTSIQDVGVGTSQALPIILEAFAQRNKLIAIEQPELHLHPRLQSELGDVFIESALGENQNTFLLETHSEHLMLRILRRIRETTEQDFSGWSEELKNACPDGIRPEDVAVLYVQPVKDGAEVIEMPISSGGDFTKPWPRGFFAERIRELYSIREDEL